MSHSADLLALLNQAASGDLTAARSFYTLFLASEVHVPLIPEFFARSEGLTAKTSIDALGFMISKSADRQILPIFTDSSFINAWSQAELASKQIAFKTLLNIATPDLWMHLNPGQEVGKEFSPWEIQLLAQGEDALDEVLSEIHDEPSATVDVDREWQPDPAAAARLRSICESYDFVQEAFLVSVIQEGQDEPRPHVGIIRAEADDERLTALASELEALEIPFDDKTAPPEVVLNIAGGRDPRARFFLGATPVYIKQQEIPERSGLKEWLSGALDAVRGKGRSGGGS